MDRTGKVGRCRSPVYVFEDVSQERFADTGRVEGVEGTERSTDGDYDWC